MITNLRTQQEMVTAHFCREVASIDAREVSTKAKLYVDDNSLNYYLLINTWLMMARQYAGVAYYELWQSIGQNGLLSTIKTLNDDAQKLVSGNSDLSGLGTQLVKGVEAPPLKGWSSSDILRKDTDIGRSKLATVLELLRYGKKFSPQHADVITEASLRDFKFVERENRRFSHLEYSRFSNGGGLNPVILDFVRDEVRKLYDWDKVCSRIDLLDASDFELPPGTTSRGNKTVADKLYELWVCSEESFYPIFGVRPLRRRTPLGDYEPTPSVVQAVPKSYKAARIIAMEDCTLNAHAREISRIFNQIDNSRVYKGERGNCPINLEHQEWNQRAAEMSAYADSPLSYATIDASHASDYVTHRLVQEVFPSEYLDRVDHLIPRKWSLDRKVHTKWMHSTSGHQLTFRHETIVYYAICRAAMTYQDLMVEPHNDALPLTVYGDDVAIDSRYADTAIEFMEKCGLHINVDKTYTSGSYRESCGKEYYEGEDVTTLYYPRFPIVGKVYDNKPIQGYSRAPHRDSYTGEWTDSLQMLIALEKKFAYWCYDAFQFLKLVVLEIYPKMTCSEIGADCADLWDYAEKGPLSPSPALYTVEEYHNLWMHKRWRTKKLGLKEGKEFQTVQHLVPYVNYAAQPSRPIIGPETENYELCRWYLYQTFLKNGPRYDTELDRLLGVSSPNPKVSTMCCQGSIDWKLAK